MVELPPVERRTLRQAVLGGLSVILMIAGMAPTPAAAHHRHHGHAGVHRGHSNFAHRAVAHGHRVAHARVIRAPLHVRPGSYTPPFSAYAVDGNSGRVLYGRDENEPRHPASLTKVMTLYLLFEQLDKHHLSLDSELHVSQHAAAQAPTKLGLRPGSTIRVEDAIKAIVTKSANDMAVAVAEQIGGDEDTFARMMTRKAHMLGMSRTQYRNASGLPDDEQLTTAKDLVVLGRAIHDNYPHYYRFFSTPSFRYAGQFMPNHNHLMEHVEGMDGIKTGYTRASGFNLLTSVRRNGHYLVSVVLGGKTRLGRDRIMEDLIEAQLDKCATTRTAAMVEENPALEQVAEAIPVVQHVGEPMPAVEAVNEDEAENKQESRQPQAPDRETAAPMQVAALAPADATEPRARPAYVPGMPKEADDRMATGSIRPRQIGLDGSTTQVSSAPTMTPSSRRSLRQAARDAREASTSDRATPLKLAKAESAKSDVDQDEDRPVAHTGWMIQIGATDDVAKANDLLGRAKAQSHGALGAAHAFTEKVHKGAGTLYRARFAGLQADTAEGACKTLKRSGFSCFAMKN